MTGQSDDPYGEKAYARRISAPGHCKYATPATPEELAQSYVDRDKRTSEAWKHRGEVDPLYGGPQPANPGVPTACPPHMAGPAPSGDWNEALAARAGQIRRELKGS